MIIKLNEAYFDNNEQELTGIKVLILNSDYEGQKSEWTFDDFADAEAWLDDNYDNWFFDNEFYAESVIFQLLCRVQNEEYDYIDNNGYAVLEQDAAGILYSNDPNDYYKDPADLFSGHYTPEEILAEYLNEIMEDSDDSVVDARIKRVLKSKSLQKKLLDSIFNELRQSSDFKRIIKSYTIDDIENDDDIQADVQGIVYDCIYNYFKINKNTAKEPESDKSYVFDKESLASYCSHIGVELDDLDTIAIPEGVTYIYAFAFKGCKNLKSVIIPDSTTRIDSYAFTDCASLKSITIGNSVTSIGQSAFNGCKSLTNIVIPDNVESIDNWAFHDCESLTSITIPNSVISIGEYTFSNCTSLTNIKMSQNIKHIGYGAFSQCKNLTSITIPDNIKNIGHDAFHGCDNLTIKCSENSYAHKYAKLYHIPKVQFI